MLCIVRWMVRSNRFDEISFRSSNYLKHQSKCLFCFVFIHVRLCYNSSNNNHQKAIFGEHFSFFIIKIDILFINCRQGETNQKKKRVKASRQVERKKIHVIAHNFLSIFFFPLLFSRWSLQFCSVQVENLTVQKGAMRGFCAACVNKVFVNICVQIWPFNWKISEWMEFNLYKICNLYI